LHYRLATDLNQLEREYLECDTTVEADAVYINYVTDRLIHTQELRPYQLAFSIDTSGVIPTINGLPVGAPSLSNGKFDWTQVNEGLGQASLLMAILIQMAKSVRTPTPAIMTEYHRRRNCRIWSKGPMSVIEEIQNQNSSVKYPLFAQNGVTICFLLKVLPFSFVIGTLKESLNQLHC